LVWVLCVAGLLGCIAASARADAAGDSARAAALFEDAQTLMAAEDYAPACAKLEESQRLDPQLGTQLHLAHCYEKRGLLASAFANFQAAAQRAAQRNASGQAEPREDVARRRAANLAPRLSTLQLQVAEPRDDLQIELDGKPLARAGWDTTFPIDPGVHSLVAHASGHQAVNHAWTIASDATHIVLAIPALALTEPREPTAASPPTVAQHEVPLPAATDPAPLPLVAATAATQPSAPPSSLQRSAGYVLASAGILGIGLGVAFGVMRNAEVSKLKTYCDVDQGTCPVEPGDSMTRDRILSLQDSAHTYATVATLGFVLGGAAVLGGLVLVLTSPHSEARTLAVSVAPTGIALSGQLDAL
jgi:hypothetical protein